MVHMATVLLVQWVNTLLKQIVHLAVLVLLVNLVIALVLLVAIYALLVLLALLAELLVHLAIPVPLQQKVLPFAQDAQTVPIVMRVALLLAKHVLLVPFQDQWHLFVLSVAMVQFQQLELLRVQFVLLVPT